ncbi:sortase [Cryobacterium psychrophilum]|uniref:Sortase n=1 Tax=Cryobacterium psychrophilum TaxID=41988 RepID=A0A4Y8KXY0_9MICO|nr:sortase [Cryobacterium psychrophilum]TDW29778.1 hypothetical protein EDD25_1488 [Cryobacterium psychrophilum]TFD81876.1 sortase [Cryobacterium psychrophilum]
MAKKTFAVIALAVLAIFAVPAAANAVGYVPEDKVAVNGSATAGAALDVIFADGSFGGPGTGERVSFAVSGRGSATLSNFKAATVTTVKSTDAQGAVTLTVTLPTDATGSYTVTGTGLTSGTVGAATLTVASADAGAGTTGDNLAATGFDVPFLLIWSAAGALLLGTALVIVLNIVRRQRANA